MEPNAAARAIAAWVEKRYQNVFWHCNRCGKSEYATPFHHSWISNFGVCKGCHDEEDSEQMDDEGACDNCGNCYVCRGTSKYMKEFHARRALRWVGPRTKKNNQRVEALIEKRARNVFAHDAWDDEGADEEPSYNADYYAAKDAWEAWIDT